MAGSNDSEMKKKIIKNMRADSRVGRRQALQILAGGDKSPRSNPLSYPTQFRCEMGPEKKRKTVGDREELHVQNWKRIRYHKTK